VARADAKWIALDVLDDRGKEGVRLSAKAREPSVSTGEMPELVSHAGGPLVAEVADSDLFRAIDRAMDQVGRALWEGLRSSRHRDRSLTRPGRMAAAAGQGG